MDNIQPRKATPSVPRTGARFSWWHWRTPVLFALIALLTPNISTKCDGPPQDQPKAWEEFTDQDYAFTPKPGFFGASLECHWRSPGLSGLLSGFVLKTSGPDGEQTYSVGKDTQYVITTPCSTVRLTVNFTTSSYKPGSHTTSPWTCRTRLVESITLRGRSDTTSPNALSTTGTALTYAQRGQGVWLVVVDSLGKLWFSSPTALEPPWGVRGSKIALIDEDFDALTVCPASDPLTDWGNWVEIKPNQTYAIWALLGSGYSQSDRFGKVKVTALGDKEVTLKLVYQEKGGLAWVWTP